MVELAWCPASGYTAHDGEHFPPDRVRTHHVHFRQRLRLGSQPPNDADHWFTFEPDGEGVRMDAALEVLSLLGSQAERFWREHVPHY